MAREDTAKLVGKLAPADAGRDAIHCAVAPVVAAEPLQPGSHVRLDSRGMAMEDDENAIGVVDPFLMKRVRTGDRFFLFLYPGSITSLRHEWTHPAFEAVAPQVTPLPDVSGSRKWLEAFAPKIAMTYDDVLSAAKGYIENGSRIRGGDDALGWQGELGDVEDDFWRHYEIVTGTKVSEEDRGNFFSCAC